MSTVFNVKTKSMLVLDAKGNPKIKVSSNPDFSSLEDKYHQHTRIQPLKQPPKSSGYTSLVGMHSDYKIMNDLPELDNIFVTVAKISDRIVGFGNTNVEYILSNLKDYNYLLRRNNQSPNPYIKALTQLLTINVYRYYSGEPYNLPTTLNRSQIEQRYNLLEYLNQSKLRY